MSYLQNWPLRSCDGTVTGLRLLSKAAAHEAQAKKLRAKQRRADRADDKAAQAHRKRHAQLGLPMPPRRRRRRRTLGPAEPSLYRTVGLMLLDQVAVRLSHPHPPGRVIAARFNVTIDHYDDRSCHYCFGMNKTELRRL